MISTNNKFGRTLRQIVLAAMIPTAIASCESPKQEYNMPTEAREPAKIEAYMPARAAADPYRDMRIPGARLDLDAWLMFHDGINGYAESIVMNEYLPDGITCVQSGSGGHLQKGTKQSEFYHGFQYVKGKGILAMIGSQGALLDENLNVLEEGYFDSLEAKIGVQYPNSWSKMMVEKMCEKYNGQ
jgi:hypothetical protein